MTYIEAMKQMLEFAEHICGGRCNAEYNPCDARDMANNLHAAIEEVEKAEPVAHLLADGDWILRDGIKELALQNGGVPFYLHPAPLTVPENLDEIAVGLAKELASNGWVHIPLDTLPEIARRLVAKLQEQGEGN